MDTTRRAPVAVERRRITIGSSPEAALGCSSAVRIGPRVVVAGTTPVWPDGQCDPDAKAQFKRCFELIVLALREAGARPEHVVRTRIYVVNALDAEAIGRAHCSFFGAVKPATTLVVVAALLDPRWKVEVEAEAVIT